MENEKLYVITAISNFQRFKSREKLYYDFKKHMEDSGAELITIECAFGFRPHVVTSANNPRHIQVRTTDELWLKENLINIAMSRLPDDWKYVAWIDADVSFVRPDWVTETIHALQHYSVIQPWSVCHDLSPANEPFNQRISFIKQWLETGMYSLTSGQYGPPGHCGYAYAATRKAMDTIGGLFDLSILGAGDHHFACALVGKPEMAVPTGISKQYRDAALAYAKRVDLLQSNIGYVDGLLNHFWHGKKADRRYVSRWDHLINNNFDPHVDVYKDSSGLLRLSGNKPGLRDGLRQYFRTRNEDSVDMD